MANIQGINLQINWDKWNVSSSLPWNFFLCPILRNYLGKLENIWRHRPRTVITESLCQIKFSDLQFSRFSSDAKDNLAKLTKRTFYRFQHCFQQILFKYKQVQMKRESFWNFTVHSILRKKCQGKDTFFDSKIASLENLKFVWNTKLVDKIFNVRGYPPSWVASTQDCAALSKLSVSCESVWAQVITPNWHFTSAQTGGMIKK